MKQVTPYVAFIPGQDDMIPDAHVYVLGHASTGDITLVDAGLMGKGKYKMDAIGHLGIPLSNVKRVIMTHTHLDHIGCLPEIRETIPDAELWVHRSEGADLENGDERTVYGMNMFQSMCQAQYGLKQGAFHFPVDRKLEGGETLELGGVSWEVIHIPGHSAGSIALYQREDQVLIPGDTVYADSAIGRFDLHGASGPQLRDSLNALGQLPVKILLPGHNRILTDTPPGYILQTARQWGPYLT